MRCLPALVGCLVAVALAACTPTYNWREIRPEGTGLRIMLPCKPDKGARAVTLGGRAAQVSMQGCEAGGHMFTVAWADAADASRAAALLDDWRTQTLATLRAQPPQPEPWAVPGAAELPAPQRVQVTGQQADGRAVHARIAWFAQGSRVYQAMLLAADPGDRALPEAADNFFSGLRLQ